MYLKPKKKLGQNFLIDRNIRRKIISFCELKPADVVLEIGAGRGEMTVPIAESVKKIYALELDTDLYELVKKNCINIPKIEIIKQDFLKFDLEKLFKKTRKKIKVIGNIPYYISTPIIQRLINYRQYIKSIFLTMQKELALRMVARCGSSDYGAFSCFIQYYAKPELLFKIKKNSFWPAPQVDSYFVRLNFLRQSKLTQKKEKILFKIIRSAFNQRRKKISNSLKKVISAEKLRHFFAEKCISPNVRPEDLSLKDFLDLACG